MESFNNKLEIGQPAMIIGCKHEENRHLIGSIVMVEAFWKKGDIVTEFFVGVPTFVSSSANNVVVSGGTHTALTKPDLHGVRYSMRNGWSSWEAKYLMPLPPLDDEQDVHNVVNKQEYA